MRAAQSIKMWIWSLFLVGRVCSAGVPAEGDIRWFEREEITIAVTDSGLGGISVVAELERRFRESRHFKKVELVFVNALFSTSGGYNSLTSRPEKIESFDRVLTAIARETKPNRILVACNTLSVLLPESQFVQHSPIPVISIVEPGVNLIAQALREVPQCRVILFATRTTVDEDRHRQAIAQMGLDAHQIVTQICPELADAIERGFDSEETQLLIAAFVDEALEKLGPSPGPVFASLNCTHFPYAEASWRAAFNAYDGGLVSILDPNSAMVDELIAFPSVPRFERSEIHVTVISKVEITQERRQSVARAVAVVSTVTARALLAYEWDPELF